jgi:hypothetical protein
LALALANTGNSMEARMPIIAITTKSSMRVKPLDFEIINFFIVLDSTMVQLNGLPLARI